MWGAPSSAGWRHRATTWSQCSATSKRQGACPLELRNCWHREVRVSTTSVGGRQETKADAKRDRRRSLPTSRPPPLRVEVFRRARPDGSGRRKSRYKSPPFGGYVFSWSKLAALVARIAPSTEWPGAFNRDSNGCDIGNLSTRPATIKLWHAPHARMGDGT